MVWVWMAAGMLTVLFVFLGSPVQIQLAFTHQEKNDEIIVEVKALLGLVHFRFGVPTLRFKGMNEGLEVKSEQVNAGAGRLIADRKQRINADKIKQMFEEFQTLLKHCFEFNVWLTRILRHVHCTKLNWKTSVGLGDAPETAFLVGTLWGVKSSLLGYIFRFVRLDTHPQLQVMPAFNQMMFVTEGTCSLRIRIWHILAGGLQLFMRICKTEGGLQVWRRVLLKTP